MARRREFHNRNHPDCILTDDGCVIRWEDATEEQREEYYYDLQGEVRSIRDADTGYGKSSRNKNRPGRGKR